MRSYSWMLALGLIASPLAACDDRDGPAEELGENIDEAVEDMNEAVEDIDDEVED